MPIVFLKSSICKWIAIVGVASRDGADSIGSVFNSNRLLRPDDRSEKGVDVRECLGAAIAVPSQ
jgi:hypothetical protein